MTFTTFDASQLNQNPFGPSNILDNGGMEIWQRGTTFSSPTDGIYTADRWKMRVLGSVPTSTVSRDSVVFDTTGFYSFKAQITSVNGATTYFVQQIVENYQDYIGKTVTISIRVKCSAANLIQANLSDGITNTLSATNVGTGWETLTLTKTLSASTTFIALSIGFISNFGGSTSPSISTFNIDNVMMVVGSTPTSFVALHPEIDLARCQRFYEISNQTHEQLVPLMRNSSTVIASYWTIPYKVTKRVIPTMTTTIGSVAIYTSPVLGNAAIGNDTANWSTNPSPGLNAFYMGATRTGGDQTIYQVGSFEFTWTASADL